ncbi:hypothetical protein AN640_05990 [Candidatus Epulonipiscium fishelsonii]|uniref:Uncharacterized protein n=1 Tax=Candidatus Epulonipiscium fishelsonii TaxID=77094 RepID=A0ACC8XHH5_9FIRM|nr:hypothetical protein AN640_05990 [Epulopiscium sp. SCG-D08WGA-EpuloA1]
MKYKKPYVIAEVGCNHLGKLDIAREFIETARIYCKVDAIKFQKRCNKELLTQEQYNAPHPVYYNSYGETYGEHREYLEFNLEEHKELKAYCEKLGIIYSCSVWDLTSAKEIVSLNPNFIKIPSACNNNYEMLDWICKNYFGEIHVSLGMTTKQEEKELVEFFEKNNRNLDVVLYACTSGYPVPTEDLCLLEITRIRELYKDRVKDIGFSGHHHGISADISAYVLGANIIERHYTLNRTWKGTDHAASLEPEGLRRVKRDLEYNYLALTYKSEDILPIEQVQRDKLKYKRNIRKAVKTKYGKSMDMRNIGRNIEKIENMIAMNKNLAESTLSFDDIQTFCRICLNAENNQMFVDIYGYKYYKCESCGSIYLTNLPNTETLYNNATTPIDHYVDKELFYKRAELIAKPKVKYILDEMKENNIKIDKWIDIGCGTGEILYILSKETNIIPIGIESDEREIEFAKSNGIDIVKGFINPYMENVEIEKILNEATIITFFNVLEHIENPIEFINYIYKHMKSNSVIVFEIPRYPSMSSFVNLTDNENVYRHIIPPIHLQVFTEDGIDILLKDKFDIISKWGFGQGYFDILTSQMLKNNNNKNKSTLYNELLLLNDTIQKEFDKKGFSDNMIFIAKKI